MPSPFENHTNFCLVFNVFWQKGGHLSGFQMVGLLDFRYHSKSGPSVWTICNPTSFGRSKSKLVQISGPHCISQDYFLTFEYQTTVGIWKPHMSGFRIFKSRLVSKWSGFWMVGFRIHNILWYCEKILQYKSCLPKTFWNRNKCCLLLYLSFDLRKSIS